MDEHLRLHVNLYEAHPDITSTAFSPVHEYLSWKGADYKRDFAPRAQHKNSTAQLEKVWEAEDKDAAILFIVQTYLIAGKLRLRSLMDKCVFKMQTIQHPSAGSLQLMVKYSERVEAMGFERDVSLRVWLVDQTAEQLFELYEQCHVTMVRFMNDCPDFREEVVDRLPLFRESRTR